MASEVKRVLEQGTVSDMDNVTEGVYSAFLREIWKLQAEVNRKLAELDKGDEPIKSRWIAIAEMSEEPVCECGVAITGGLHSDWCPLKESDG